MAHRQGPTHELWTCTSNCTRGSGWSGTRPLGTDVVDAELRAPGAPHVAYVAGDGRLVHSVCRERCECVGECEQGQDWEGETLVNDARRSVGRALDGEQPVVVAVTPQSGAHDRLRLFRCTACGEAGSYGPPPSGDPPPSTSTYAPESSTNGGSQPSPSSDDEGSPSTRTTSTTAGESAPSASDPGRTSWTLPGPDTAGSGDPAVRERYRLEDRQPEVRSAESDGVEAPGLPPSGRDEQATGSGGDLVDRGAPALAATLFLVFGGLALLVYLRLVRPLTRIRRRWASARPRIRRCRRGHH